MPGLGDLLAARRPQPSPSPGATPPPADDPFAQAQRLAAMQGAVAQGAAPATGALEGANLGTMPAQGPQLPEAIPLGDGQHVALPAKVWSDIQLILRNIGIGGSKNAPR